MEHPPRTLHEMRLLNMNTACSSWPGCMDRDRGRGQVGARRGKSPKVGQSTLSRVDCTSTGEERADLGALLMPSRRAGHDC